MTDIINTLPKDVKNEILADAMEKLIKHLQDRSDVQNIDLMNLSGFCRNCISRWISESALKHNISLDKLQARKFVYGMDPALWKDKYQKPATEAQLKQFNSKN